MPHDRVVQGLGNVITCDAETSGTFGAWSRRRTRQDGVVVVVIVLVVVVLVFVVSSSS